jgi:hypothetical protein
MEEAELQEAIAKEAAKDFYIGRARFLDSLKGMVSDVDSWL